MGDDVPEPEDDEATRFVDGLIARGEAAYPDDQGNLPAGATHEITTDDRGRRLVRRRRFTGD